MNRLTGWKRNRAATVSNHSPEGQECCGERTTTPPLLLTLALALGLIAVMVSLVGGPTTREARAMPGDQAYSLQSGTSGGIRYVAMSGEDDSGCEAEGTPCRTVQYAVDQAVPGEEVRVAAGTYTGISDLGGLSQLVFLSKTLTVRGGYTTSNWTTPDPETNPTTLDAEGDGRVMVISDTITV
ncbi:MAG: hypothetical protein GWN58_37060, partial [Anaerolineae bacterium]|nr:hypothetical protein [Anaerolineae bacterium]